MATKIGPKTVTQRDRSKNLVFCIDAAHSDSYGGPPATNLVDFDNIRGSIGSHATWSGGDDGSHTFTSLENYRYKLEIDASTVQGYGLVIPATVSASTAYTFSVRRFIRRRESSSDDRGFYIRYYDSGDNVLGGDGGYYNSSASVSDPIGNNYDVSDLFSTTFTTPASCVKVEFWVGYGGGPVDGDWVVLQRPQVEAGSVVTPFTASSRDSGPPEILADGGFETWGSSTNLTHWYESNSYGSSTHQDSAEQESGAHCVRLDVSASDGNVHVYTSVAPFEAGKRYRVAVSAKCSSGTLTASIYESEASYVPSPTGLGEDLALTTSYQTFVFEFTAAGADGLHGTSVGDNTNLLLGRKLGGGAASKSIYFDNASIVELGRGADAVKDISGTVKRGLSLQGSYATYGQHLQRPSNAGYGLGESSIQGPPRKVLKTYDPNKGHIGGAYWDFDGTDEYLDLGLIDFGTKNITVALWFQVELFDDDYANVFNNRDAAGDDLGFSIRQKISGAELEFIFDWGTAGGGSALVETAGLSVNTWYHVVALLDRSYKMRGYLNGVEFGSSVDVSSRSSYSITNTATAKIGRDEGGNFWNGQVANCMIWEAALTAKEIKDIYIAQKGRFGK